MVADQLTGIEMYANMPEWQIEQPSKQLKHQRISKSLKNKMNQGEKMTKN